MLSIPGSWLNLWVPRGFRSESLKLSCAGSSSSRAGPKCSQSRGMVWKQASAAGAVAAGAEEYALCPWRASVSDQSSSPREVRADTRGVMQLCDSESDCGP